MPFFKKHVPYPLGWGGDFSFFGSNRIKAKDINSCTYYWYIKCAILIEWVGWMLRPKRGATHIDNTIWIVRTSRQRSCNSKGWLWSRTFWPAQWLGCYQSMNHMPSLTDTDGEWFELKSCFASRNVIVIVESKWNKTIYLFPSILCKLPILTEGFLPHYIIEFPLLLVFIF